MLLAPYRVLDLTGPLGFMAGRVMADLGADVVKIEAPGGDPARRIPPVVETADGPLSLYWLGCNANKRSVTIDLQAPAGRDLFRKLAAKADFIIESYSPGTLDSWGLGYRDLSKLNKGLILVSITPFGQEGPYRNFRASDLEIMALGGAMGLAGEKDGEPMRVAAPQAPMFAGLEAVMGALTALAARSASGNGQHVDVSAQVAVIASLGPAPAHWDLNEDNPQRAGIYMTGRTVTDAKFRVFWPCRDGWINFVIYGGVAGRESNRQLVNWMCERNAAPEWLAQMDWSCFEVPSLTQGDIDRLEQPIADFFATLTKLEFRDGAVAHGILGYPVSTVEDIYEDRQLAARQFWQLRQVATPHGSQDVKFPGSFAVVDGERLPVRAAQARAGEHNAEILE